ncbi:hypothetical protein MAMC_00093 [Methylacidimicrobium cyclopophantes]|uniref:DUF2062 domain-containing protein n=1 Tax=Methylacidimicrobium cyclopophantes TaxID=1041766 RepID=A0A5E6M4M9_9BACT|nr:DUF2062 domain-containing protein [Methylacidimicrobium cyclopophantes]VVM04531.1 hypothetical protein MAMC_00093 [Methylacidimicrobium cyclopophantes]
MNLRPRRLWHLLKDHAQHPHKKLFHLRADPFPIALGFAIGIFYGFTPFFGFKTVLAFITAWPLRANLIAAALGVAAHDIALPFVPGLLWLEYQIGAFLLGYGSQSHLLPMGHVSFRDVVSWKGLMRWGWPMTVGSLIVGLPAAGVAFFLVHRALLRYRENGPSSENETKTGPPDRKTGKTEAPPVNFDAATQPSALRTQARRAP